MNNIFSSSKKSSSTFHKILEEKGIIVPTRHLRLTPPTFPSNVLSDEEPDVSFAPSPSEYRCSCEPHVSSCENKDNSHDSDALSVSSHPSPTYECNHLVSNLTS